MAKSLIQDRIFQDQIEDFLMLVRTGEKRANMPQRLGRHPRTVERYYTYCRRKGLLPAAA